MCGHSGCAAMRGALSILGFAALIAAPGVAGAQTAHADPWEGLNRNLFAIHQEVDQAVLEPIARGYRAVTPRPLRQGVLNFLRNLRGPVIFANDVLQGELARAGTTAARFGLNTTVGVAGLFDPATAVGLERHDEDFGQTLAVWGVDAGPYIFVPVLGPTTVRDGAGRLVDLAFDPLTWAEFDEAEEVRIGRAAMSGLSARELAIEPVDDIRRDSPDPYVTIRSSYTLLRESAIQNGRSDVQDLPEFEEVEELPGEDAAPADEANGQQSPTTVSTPHSTALAKALSDTRSMAVAGEWK